MMIKSPEIHYQMIRLRDV